MNQLKGILLGLVLISGAVFMPAQSFAQPSDHFGPYSSFFELMKYLFSSGNVTIVNDSGSVLNFNKATIILSSSTTTTESGSSTVISIKNVSLHEGNSGTKNFVFKVKRAGNLSGESSVDFATSDGTATISDSDYVSNSGTLDFATGETTKTVTVLVNGNTVVEPHETFTMNLDNCISCFIIDDQGLGTIKNDDSANGGSGDNESGDNESGDNESGDNESGDNESGDNESGDNESGDNESGDNESGDNHSNGNSHHGKVTPSSGTSVESEKETICHVSPGNGSNHTITVGQSAVSAHLAHGDSLGACDTQDSHSDAKESKKQNDEQSNKQNNKQSNKKNNKHNDD